MLIRTALPLVSERLPIAPMQRTSSSLATPARSVRLALLTATSCAVGLFAISIGVSVLSQAGLGGFSFQSKLMGFKASRINPIDALRYE